MTKKEKRVRHVDDAGEPYAVAGCFHWRIFIARTHSSQQRYKPMEHNAFASFAHFRVLLLPVGAISRATFDRWAAEIRTLENLRLSDIPPGTRDEKGEHLYSHSKGPAC
jgi:hypothetical protein